MNITYDNDADAIYIEFRKGTFFKNKKVDNFTIIDYDKKNNMLGIELINASNECLKNSYQRSM